MPHVVRTHPDHPIVEVIVHGAIQDPEVVAVFDKAKALLTESGIGDVLVDCREMSNTLTYTEVVAAATELADSGVPTHWRQAIIKPQDLATAVTVSLWEAACNNRGLKAKVFRDHDSALAWLLATDPSSPGASAAPPGS